MPPIVAAAKTIDSAVPNVTAPPAWLASLPVSKVSVFLPIVAAYFFDSGFILSPVSADNPHHQSAVSKNLAQTNRFAQVPSTLFLWWVGQP
jgi:hypothetical protein